MPADRFANYRTAKKLIESPSSDIIVLLKTVEITLLPRHIILVLLLALTALTLSGCGSWWLPRPHRILIQQGNIMSTEAITQVSVGMTKIEVINTLGKPITTSVFDEERWDYIYSFNRSGGKPKSKRFTVFFKDDIVYRVESDGFETDASADTL